MNREFYLVSNSIRGQSLLWPLAHAERILKTKIFSSLARKRANFGGRELKFVTDKIRSLTQPAAKRLVLQDNFGIAEGRRRVLKFRGLLRVSSLPALNSWPICAKIDLFLPSPGKFKQADNQTMLKIFFSFIIFLSFSLPVLAAQDSLTNIQPGQAAPRQSLVPGMLILLPDGRRALIQEALPDGLLRTDLGEIITPEGLIAEGAAKGQAVAILEAPDPDLTPDSSIALTPARTQEPENGQEPQLKPETPVQEPRREPIPQPMVKEPEIAQVAEPKTQTPVEPNAPGVVAVPKPQTPVEPAPPSTQANEPLTIVELLPMTTLPGPQKEQPKAEKPAKPEPEQKAGVKPQEKPAIQQKAEAKPQEKPVPQQKGKHQPEPPKKEPEKYKKPSVGQELRIPPDAAKTGKLDFLEGCWQGTRPEYYSKRTIRECFCFDKNGQAGKRRIFDNNLRQCIGSAKASLSSSGVLSVTSSGAACSDGERWGSARMTCQNSGPRTPCSWTFPDTYGGHQSYTIPFVRVESCGR